MLWRNRGVWRGHSGDFAQVISEPIFDIARLVEGERRRLDSDNAEGFSPQMHTGPTTLSTKPPGDVKL